MADVVVDPDCNDPKELFGQGVRACIIQDYEAAVSALGKASELLVAEHKNDLHESLGEVYLYYGKALLGLARDQNEALGDAVPKNSADDSEDDDDEDDEDVKESEEKTETTNDTPAESGDAPDVKEQNGENGITAEASSSSENGKPGPSSANDEETTEEQNGEEEPSDLQVAWEVLELAKKIFENKEDKKSLADTLIVLGEVSLESENFESAINDVKKGLEIQKELFPKDSRTVAESFYKLGMAYSTDSQIDQAIENFNNSLEYLRNRIKTLEEIKLMTQEHKDEVDEIKSLIPDIEDKIADMNVYKEEAIKKISEAFKEPSKQTTDGAGSSKQVSDISHLVKRKRKIEETDPEQNVDNPNKKAA
ncbi:protein HGV2 [Sitophilus oryzae]|uniref:Protein HGV2 n=1 Tax=Sitophilus oryzae TaxID=7048 RepID=A0A6J2XMN8_SITOR|nr:protein HGV2 [Sitophilus oryzae]XP_030751934.1 protein HGV2 [Sitophilus oryzae]